MSPVKPYGNVGTQDNHVYSVRGRIKVNITHSLDWVVRNKGIRVTQGNTVLLLYLAVVATVFPVLSLIYPDCLATFTPPHMYILCYSLYIALFSFSFCKYLSYVLTVGNGLVC